MIPQQAEVWGWIFFKNFFLYVILKLCTDFQIPTMPATGQKFVVVVWWLKPILVFSLAQAEQYGPSASIS